MFMKKHCIHKKKFKFNKIIFQVHVIDIYSRSREYSSPRVECKINK